MRRETVYATRFFALRTAFDVLVDRRAPISRLDQTFVRPGKIPPANIAPTERFAALARMIIMIDGGMIPPMVDATAVNAALNGAE